MSNRDDPGAAQEARQKLVSDWLFLSHSMRTCADSINRYISFLAGSHSQADFLQNIVQLPNLHSLNPTDPKDVPLGATATGKKKRARSGDEDEEKSKKRKGPKKEKDPNAPKRPPSAYIFFQNKIRQSMRDANPDMPYRDLVSSIGQRWKELPTEEKKVYQDMASSEMAKWRADTEQYKTGNAAAAAAAAEGEDDDEEDEDDDEAPTAKAPAAAASESDDEEESDETDDDDVKKLAPAPAPVQAPASTSKSGKKSKSEAKAAAPVSTPAPVKSSQPEKKKKSKKAD